MKWRFALNRSWTFGRRVTTTYLRDEEITIHRLSTSPGGSDYAIISKMGQDWQVGVLVPVSWIKRIDNLPERVQS